jgi:hypothetical protein
MVCPPGDAAAPVLRGQVWGGRDGAISASPPAQSGRLSAPHENSPTGATNEGAVVQEAFACLQRWIDAQRTSGDPTIHDLETALCALPQPSPKSNGAADFGWIGCRAFASIRNSAEACFGAGLVAAGAFHKSARTRRERFRSRSIQAILRNLAAMLGCSCRAAPERCLREVGATEVGSKRTLI